MWRSRILGGWLAVRKLITIGDIQAFIQYVRTFTQPITQMANISNVLQPTAAAAERVFEFLEEAEESPRLTNPITLETVQGESSSSDVHFGYNPEKPVIKDFSAVIKPGQKVAIVGPTGAGKTTMVKLLMRFYDVNSGAIKVDGHGYPRIQPAGPALTCSAWCCRIPGCLTAPSWKTSATAGRMRPMKRSSPPPKPPTSIISSAPCRTATRWC